MFGAQAATRRGDPREKGTSRKKKKRAIISEYEELYDVNLTEEELEMLIEESFSNPDISSETKEKVKKKLKDKKKKEKPKKKE